MTREAGAKLVIYGGSSCLFGIDAERLLHTHQMPAVNLGRGAGMGASVLTLAALQYTRPGDTLVAALEPSLLTGSLEPPRSAAIQHSPANRLGGTPRRPARKLLSWPHLA